MCEYEFYHEFLITCDGGTQKFLVYYYDMFYELYICQQEFWNDTK